MIKFIDKGKTFRVLESNAVVETLKDAYTTDTKVKVMDIKTDEIYFVDPHFLIPVDEIKVKSESELLKEWDQQNNPITIAKGNKSNVNSIEGCTEKESIVLKAMHDNTIEFGLPVDTATIKEETGFSKRSIVGIVGSLHKKGFLESYDLEYENEYMLTSETYDMLNELEG